MDWIDGLLEKWKREIADLSLRKAMVVYLVVAILLTLAACAVTWQICNSWKEVIRQVNGIEEDYQYVSDGAFALYYEGGDNIVVRGMDMLSLEKEDTMLWNILSTVELLCIPVYSLCAVLAVSAIYYRNKLREPISLLKLEMEAIKRDDLSFSCFYDSADEMGDICKTMDTMRKKVVDNQKNLWELMEEQRKVNAAFAHDLRTPLTVISGYADMLMEYYPKGQISEEKMMEIFSAVHGQADRMRSFTETMKEMQSFEVLEVSKKRHTAADLEEDIRSITTGLENENTPVISVSTKISRQEIYYDENVVMEVLGNLLSNALRYGRKKIEILAEQQNDNLFLYVKDDGRGLTGEELYKADSPFYSDKTKEEGEKTLSQRDGAVKEEGNMHFGIGLTICKILCKKHGGGISFSNSVEGGAIVCAEFFVG